MKNLFTCVLVCTIGMGAISFQACSTVNEHAHGSITKNDFDYDKIAESLQNEGIIGEVHSAVPEFNLYVFTLRDKDNFFNYVQMSMITRNHALKKKLDSLKRHDKIQIWGKFADNDSPQKHIKLKQINLITKYIPTPDIPKHDYPTNVPAELKSKNSAKFLVHAVHADGQILVLEYKQVIVPIFVRRNELSKDLYRGDKIIVHYKIQDSPGRPTHLELDPEVTNPIEAYDSLVEQHGKQAELIGELILFPKSPQVSFDVWALLQTDSDGIRRNYTIINFEDSQLFKAIRSKLANAWKTDPTNFVSGRNKLVHNRIKVKATGTLNVVDPNQANPQIMIDHLNDVEIIY